MAVEHGEVDHGQRWRASSIDFSIATANPIARTARPVQMPDARTRVPAFANEDIYFFMKRIDNTRRGAPGGSEGARHLLEADRIGGRRGRPVVGVLLPSAYGLLAGYQIQSLQMKRSGWRPNRRRWSWRKRNCSRPQRMEELARMQQFIDPPSQTSRLSRYGARIPGHEQREVMASNRVRRSCRKINLRGG